MSKKNIICIDGTWYNVGVKDLSRENPVIDKYANRSEAGGVSREILGVYQNYYLTFGDIIDPDEYKQVHDILIQDQEYHELILPGTQGWYEYTAYISSVGDSLKKLMDDGKHKWKGLKASFVAKDPMG